MNSSKTLKHQSKMSTMDISALYFSSSVYSQSRSHPTLSSSSSSLFNPNPTLFTKSRIIKNTRRFSLVSRPDRKARNKNKDLSCTCLFGLGVPELVVIAGVVALVFGPKKLPEVGRSIGKTVKSFQQAAKEFETELNKEPDSLSEPPPVEKPVPSSASKADKQDASES